MSFANPLYWRRFVLPSKPLPGTLSRAPFRQPCVSVQQIEEMRILPTCGFADLDFLSRQKGLHKSSYATSFFLKIPRATLEVFI